MNQLTFTITGFHNKFAILNNSIYGNIFWPIKELPANIEINQTITLGVINQNTANSIDQHKLLEELIN